MKRDRAAYEVCHSSLCAIKAYGGVLCTCNDGFWDKLDWPEIMECWVDTAWAAMVRKFGVESIMDGLSHLPVTYA